MPEALVRGCSLKQPLHLQRGGGDGAACCPRSHPDQQEGRVEAKGARRTRGRAPGVDCARRGNAEGTNAFGASHSRTSKYSACRACKQRGRGAAGAFLCRRGHEAGGGTNRACRAGGRANASRPPSSSSAYHCRRRGEANSIWREVNKLFRKFILAHFAIGHIRQTATPYRSPQAQNTSCHRQPQHQPPRHSCEVPSNHVYE